MRVLFGVLIAVLTGTVAMAEDEGGDYAIGKDVFSASQTVTFTEPDRDDLFLAGERVTIGTDAAGSAHVFGRWLSLDGAIGANAYAAGQRVTVKGAVGGNATLLGQTVQVTAPVAGNLRATGSDVKLTGDVGGYAMIAAERLDLDATVAGDLALTARSVDFGTDARVEGTLHLYEAQPGSLKVPASVAPEDRIERHKSEAWKKDHRGGLVSWRGMIGGFLFGVLVVAAVAALIAALVPEALAAMRRRILDRPGRTLGLGFVTLSALAGAGLVVALTGIGILLTPAFFLLAGVAGFFGYVVGAYALGVAVLRAAGRHLPDSIGDRALAAGVGALLAGVIGLVPFLGWLFVLAVLLTGLGALAVRLLPEQLSGAPRY